MALQITGNSNPSSNFALFNLGFRPFFLGAGLYGAYSILIWVWSYWSGQPWFPATLSPSLWHAHEMLFGYSAAVIAGFLLTATRNWTQQPTPTHLHLALLFCCWLTARLLVLMPGVPLWLLAVVDTGFNLWLFAVIALPIIRVRQSRQYPILGKLIFLTITNGLFYAQALGVTENTASNSLYLAFFVIIGLILMMCRRLIPFFTERGVGETITLKNSRLLDISSMVIFIAFMLLEVFTELTVLTPALAAILTIILAIRGFWWHHKAIWNRPLLWSLHLAYWLITLGLLGYALVPFTAMTSLLALHTLAIGGIGLVTVAMMARVSLGHTGRDIHQPPGSVIIIFLTLLAAVLVRVAGALLLPQHYYYLVIISGLCWFAGLLIFALRYWAILQTKRIDGKEG